MLLLGCCCCLCECGGGVVGPKIESGSVNNNSNQVSGGGCDYSSYSGTARVTEVEPEPGYDANSSPELVVRFEVARPDPRFPELKPVFRQNPEYRARVSRSELKEKQIIKGTEYRVEVRELRSGTCEPYSFKFDW